MTAIDFQILAVGAWGPGFQNWLDLTAAFNGKPLLKGDALTDEALANYAKGPKPEVIPANERRRAPLSVRLAVESSWQAVNNAGLDAADLPCVFVSGIGDTQLTDYMCAVLATDNKALSPTKFHNSVHNAAAGYWTISTGCTQAANSVAGFQESVGLTLMEALIQCQSEQRPILITFYDAPSSEVLSELLINDVPFAASIIVAPKGYSDKKPNYSAQVRQENVELPGFDAQAVLQNCYAKNPAAKILPLLQALAVDGMLIEGQSAGNVIEMPLSPQTSLQITLAPRI